MTNILVLSDIHIPGRMHDFPFEKVEQYAKKSDYIFGLGDYTNEYVIDILYSLNKNICLVSGNMDDASVKSKLAVKSDIKIEEINIGLIHGWGAPFGIREKIRNEFLNADLICYGHTHSSYFKNDRGIYFFNPGSLSDANRNFGILKINKKAISAEFI